MAQVLHTFMDEPTQCGHCPEKIERGDHAISFNDGFKWVHKNCPDRELEGQSED